MVLHILEKALKIIMQVSPADALMCLFVTGGYFSIILVTHSTSSFIH